MSLNTINNNQRDGYSVAFQPVEKASESWLFRVKNGIIKEEITQEKERQKCLVKTEITDEIQ